MEVTQYHIGEVGGDVEGISGGGDVELRGYRGGCRGGGVACSFPCRVL